MLQEKECIKRLLHGIWDGDMTGVKLALKEGANPSYRVNGYPLLLHAVYTRNVEVVQLLIQYGALQTQEALGLAIENHDMAMIVELMKLGIVPKKRTINKDFGPYPCRQTAIRRNDAYYRC